LPEKHRRNLQQSAAFMRRFVIPKKTLIVNFRFLLVFTGENADDVFVLDKEKTHAFVSL
jgi:hypothetical protein